MKAILYARVSTREQEKEGYSIPAQVQLLEEYAEKNGLSIVQRFSEAETAKKSGREEFDRMLEYVRRAKEPHCILVEKTDRLYRNFKDYVRIEELDVEIHLVKEGEVLSKDSKSHIKFIHGIKVLMAKNYIDNLSEEVKKGMYEKASQGHFPFLAPYGYRNNKETRMIELNEDEASYVRRAFELYSTGNYSLKQLKDQLFQEGYVYKVNTPKIMKGALEKMLKNIFYTGDFIIKDQFFRGKHTPLVSLELFNKVQENFKKANKARKFKHDFAFAGLMTCGHCGCAVVGQIQREQYIYYHCSNYKGNCGDPYVREEVLAEQFTQAVKALVPDEELMEWLVSGLKDSHKDKIIFHNERLEELQAQRKKLMARMDAIYEDKLDGKIPEELWFRKNEQYKQELARVESTLQEHHNGNQNYLALGVQVLEMAKNAYPLYVCLNPHQQRQMLNFLLSNITLKAGKLDYTYKKPFCYITEGSKTEEWWAIGDLNTGPHPYQPS